MSTVARARTALMMGICMLSAAACGAATTSNHGTSSASTASAALPPPGACPAPAISPPSGPIVPPEPSRPDAVQATIRIGAGSGPQFSAAGFGSIWVAAYRGEFIDRIDPQTNAVQAKIPLPRIAGQPVASGRLITGPDGVWIQTGESTTPATGPAPNELVRIDPATNRVTVQAPIDSLAEVVDGPDGLWGLLDPWTGGATRVSLVRIDPVTGKVLRTIDLAPASLPHTHTPEIDDGLGSLWVVIADNEVARVNPSTGAVTATIRTPSVPFGFVVMAFVGQHLFVSEADTTIARIDTATNCVDGLMYLRSHSLGSGQSLVAAAQGLYVAFDLGALALVDPSTLSVRASLRLDSQDFVAAPTAAFGSIWYPTSVGDSVIRVRPLAAPA